MFDSLTMEFEHELRGTNVNILKGIGAILAGMIFIVATHTGTDFVLESLGIFTQPNEGFHTTTNQTGDNMQKITPFLWFDDKAEEAVNFYVSVFKNSKISGITRYDEEGSKAAGRPKGTVMTVEFQLEGQEFTALNGGPHFKFTEAISLVVNCETQEEVDKFWEKLSEGGEKSRCGWLKDKYGLSWQVVPTVLAEMFLDKDAERSKRVMKAMLQMDKLDIKALKQAYEQQ
jgi:predicted 3-demethylubiquinone-9 3-methyltransferase (glyoxalase superfamily)